MKKNNSYNYPQSIIGFKILFMCPVYIISLCLNTCPLFMVKSRKYITHGKVKEMNWTKGLVPLLPAPQICLHYEYVLKRHYKDEHNGDYYVLVHHIKHFIFPRLIQHRTEHYVRSNVPDSFLMSSAAEQKHIPMPSLCSFQKTPVRLDWLAHIRFWAYNEVS